MSTTLRSIWMWFATTTTVLIWLPLLAIIRLFDRDPPYFRAGRWFRRLGMAVVKLNPAWRVHIAGREHVQHNQAYVVVSNHQSMVDIPLLSCLPWEMKWIAKAELFRLPIIGWMMRMAGDIPLDRKKRGGAQALLRAKRYLHQNCSVMIFPEGTRSPDGSLQPFTDGAFHLAIKAQVPVLPIVLEGSHSCLQKGSWKFGEPQDIYLQILPPVPTTGMTTRETEHLNEHVHQEILHELTRLRATSEA